MKNMKTKEYFKRSSAIALCCTIVAYGTVLIKDSPQWLQGVFALGLTLSALCFGLVFSTIERDN